MDNTINFFARVWEENPHYLMLGGLLLLIGVIGKIKLFIKADQSWIAALVPIWDVAATLRIVGRPMSHLAYFLVPGFNIYFAFKVLIEVAQTFGKRSTVDYALVCIFNVFYLLNLGLAYNEEYEGPVYGRDIKKDVHATKHALA